LLIIKNIVIDHVIKNIDSFTKPITIIFMDKYFKEIRKKIGYDYVEKLNYSIKKNIFK
jgi:c-di-AMP phosphodiesterase-like protein